VPKVTIIVDHRLRVDLTTAPKSFPLDEIKGLFEHVNPKWKPATKRRKGTPNEEPIIRTWRVTRDDEGHEWIELPRGGMTRIRQALSDAKLSWTTVDRRSEGDAHLMIGENIVHTMTPRPYQRAALKAALAKENCVIHAPTGAGKTCILLAAIAEAGVPAMVVVANGGLLQQWADRCRAELGIDPVIVRGPNRDDFGPVTLAMEQTLYRHPQWIAANAHRYGLIACDEVQDFAARTFFAAVDPFPCRYRIGVSADSTRKDKKEFLIYDLFGAVAYEVAQEDLVSDGFVMDVAIRVIPTDTKAEWYKLKVKQRRVQNYDYVKLLELLSKDKDRNALVVELAQREALDGQSILVWCSRVEQCHTIDSMLARHNVLSGLMLGGKPYAKQFEETKQGLATGTLQAGVGTLQAVGQATDIPALSRGILTLPLASNKQKFNQARGRICRPSKSKSPPELYYLYDEHIFGKPPLQNLVKWYRDKVTVWDGDRWISAREYLKRDKLEKSYDDLEGIFVAE
jgi:superfamily II DNA or RNA helicase